MMGDASHPFHALANAFEADADNNQVADGDQLDLDLDNTADSEDAGKADSAVRKFTIPEPRYAVFPITSASPPELHKRPIQINGQGTVLYVNGTWSGGNWLELTTSAGELTGCVARGINDGGEIVGFGSYELNAEHNRRGSVLTHWPARNAAPTAVSVDDFFAMTYQDLEYSPYRGPVLSNDGRVIAPAATIETLEDDIAEKFVPTPGGSRFMWTLPATGRTAGKVQVAGGMSLVGASGAYWGFDVETGKGVINGAGNLAPLDWVPLNVVDISPGIPVAFGSTETLVHYNGSWHAAGTYAKTSDMSAEGIAIARSPSGMLAPILVNGKWRPIYRAASSNLPEEWRSSDVQLVDTSSNGWVLGKRGEGDGATYAAMLPLKVEGEFVNSKGITVRKFAGVDDFSVAADTISLPALDRLWIMAPQSTTKTTTFKAPLTGGSPLTISGTGITFGGNQMITLSAEETTVAVQAAATSSSGDEVLAELTLGGGATSVSKPLGFKIMKDRAVRVAVYKVTKADASGNPEVIPTLIPDEQELEDFLNDVFKPQLNTTFSVRIETDPLVAAWDLGGEDGSLDGDPDYTTGNHNGEQDVVKLKKDNRIQELSGQPGYTPFEEHITVFIVGSQKLISGTAFATAVRKERTCWIFGNLDAYTNLNPVRPYDPEEGHLRTIAHEIGHILVGEGHPDQRAFPGPAHLPGTEHRRRLMCSGGTSGLNPGNLLVKGEWDEAEIWLESNVDSRP